VVLWKNKEMSFLFNIKTLGFGAIACFLAWGSPVSARAQTLIFWHNQTGLQARFVEKLIAEFNAKHAHTQIRGETGLELESSLLSRIDPGVRPDLLLIPSDMMGLSQDLRLLQLPADWDPISKRPGIPSDPHGVPILRGNQLLLFYNKRLVNSVPATWADLKMQQEKLKSAGVHTIGWPFAEPYYFIPFLRAFGSFDPDHLDSPTMELALDFYRDLAVHGLVPQDCGLDCNTSRFYRGEFAFVISGDWQIAEAKAKLKGDFGMAPLPQMSEGRPLVSDEAIQYLVFPNKKNFEKNKKVLRQFGEYLSSVPVQNRWQQRMNRVPVVSSGRPLPGNFARRRSVYAWIALQKGLQLIKSGKKGIPLEMQNQLEILKRSEGQTR